MRWLFLLFIVLNCSTQKQVSWWNKSHFLKLIPAKFESYTGKKLVSTERGNDLRRRKITKGKSYPTPRFVLHNTIYLGKKKYPTYLWPVPEFTSIWMAWNHHSDATRFGWDNNMSALAVWEKRRRCQRTTWRHTAAAPQRSLNGCDIIKLNTTPRRPKHGG